MACVLDFLYIPYSALFHEFIRLVLAGLSAGQG